VLFPSVQSPLGPAFAGMFSSAGGGVTGMGRGRGSGRGRGTRLHRESAAGGAGAGWVVPSAGMFTALTIGDRKGGTGAPAAVRRPDAKRPSDFQLVSKTRERPTLND